MNRNQIISVLLACFLSAPVGADEKKPDSPDKRPAITKKTPDELPAGIKRFNGMLVGRLVEKDVEKGTFILNVDAVPRVWRNSKAENPKSVIGKNVSVDGVFGKWLDVLLLVKEGESLEFECRHDGGDGLTFPGELLRKVGPFKPSDFPVLPDEFRGFHGAVAAKIVKKDAETLELIVEVARVLDTWKENGAKKPESIVQRQVMLGGFWRRKEEYHGLKVGDHIEVGLQHIGRQSDHLSVVEFVRKASAKTSTDPTNEPASTTDAAKTDAAKTDAAKTDAAKTDSAEFPSGMQGFNGMLVGRLLKKDVERGTFVVAVDAVPRVWRNSKAKSPKSIVQRTVNVDGVTGKWLDVLLLVKKGETLEFEARHDGGAGLTFPGELLRKVAPYKAEDYPELPESFRGFTGAVAATIIKKDAETFELIVKVERVLETAKNNQAKKPESIVGRQMMLTGFWQKKEAYHQLRVGDRIEAGIRHIGRQSDHLSVSEFVRKTDKK